jgi:hypothetical protein
MTTRQRVVITLASGLALIAVVLVVVLLQAPRKIISTNYIPISQGLGLLSPNTTVCQADERIPASTAALRMSLIAYIGPAVSVTVSHQNQVLARGHRNAGWVSSSLTLPLQRQVTTPSEATICLTRGGGAAVAGLEGATVPGALAATVDGMPLPGRLRVEYLARGHQSWLALAKHVARRLGLGHSPSGTWIVLPLVLIMALAVTFGAWLLLREARYE